MLDESAIRVMGRYYRVPTVTIPLLNMDPRIAGRTYPIMGPLHEDVAIIGFHATHWHVDPRFMSDRQLRAYVLGLPDYPDDVAALGWPLSIEVVKSMYGMPAGLRIVDPCPEVVLRLRKCHREMPLFPSRYGWQKCLEDAYAGERLKPGLICPHRGFQLAGLTPDAEGHVVCPGHGLCWDVASGALVRREP